MPLLITLKFNHFGSHNEKSGTEALVIADTIDQFHKWVEKTHHISGWDEEGRNEQDSFWPYREWVEKHPDWATSAKEAGLTVDDSDLPTVKGPKWLLTQWFGGNTYNDAGCDDATYGVTKHHWDKPLQIYDFQADVLLKLKIATDLRKTP
jgi:hypothetical protein